MNRRILYRVFMTVGIYIMTADIVGFFSMALFTEGACEWLGATREWPMGFSPGVAQTADGHFIAINNLSRRIQYYDHQWTFKWGVCIDSSGGAFKIASVGKDTFEVVTVGGSNRYLIDYNGNVLSKTNYPKSVRYKDFNDIGHLAWVPTNIFLLPLATPLLAFLAIFLGTSLVAITIKIFRLPNQYCK